MNTIDLIEIEWNCYNGLIISILYLDLNKLNIDSSLFGLYISIDFLYIDILFITLKIFDKDKNKLKF
jgi:hypothetical protein